MWKNNNGCYNCRHKVDMEDCTRNVEVTCKLPREGNEKTNYSKIRFHRLDRIVCSEWKEN